MSKISNGFRFRPTDDECIAYLLGFVTGNSPPSHGFISIADLYGQTEPWDLFENSEVKSGGCRYFFTKLKKVGAKKGRSYQRYSRNVGAGGNWSNKGQKSDIIGPKGNIIGHSRTFRYQPRNSDHVGPTRGEWALKEYSLPEGTVLGLDEDLRDYVLCLLKKKKEKKITSTGVVQAVEADFDYLVATLAATSSDDVAPVETNEVMWPTLHAWTGVNDVVPSLTLPVTGGEVVWPSVMESLPTTHQNMWTGVNDVLPPESCWSKDLRLLAECVGLGEVNINEDCSQNELATCGEAMWRSINERSPLHMWSGVGDDDPVLEDDSFDLDDVDNWLRENGVPQPAAIVLQFHIQTGADSPKFEPQGVHHIRDCLIFRLQNGVLLEQLIHLLDHPLDSGRDEFWVEPNRRAPDNHAASVEAQFFADLEPGLEAHLLALFLAGD
ncbi:NAC domain containing protein 2 [Striga asiatica]|uniref:NAC domain containing protein 2 n=1 Tax=Striga asiatica TaxID=4170 RepID=A0A5A7P9W2_STRAF|nr:NAC domain containing protein 2 [Striga asiatica]